MALPDRERWKQLSPLLDELLALAPDERRHRLAEQRERDAALADELGRHLAAADEARAANFLGGPAPDVDGPGGSGGPGATLVGKTIGNYVIEALLGQGGTGSVWRARRSDGRYEGRVAVKLLHLSLLGRDGALRFEREGAILARLRHPNIAQLMDAGVTPDGQPYLVLELVEGDPIDAYCDARSLGVEPRLALFADVLAAVAHAHSQLVIHRDIKPSNVLVGADGRVKLLDFGIARLLQDDDLHGTLTVDARPALTPQYAAPEQVQAAPVSAATDVYALGVLLFRLLGGRHPTCADNASAAEALRATLETEPLRLSRALTPGAGADAAAVWQVAQRRDSTTARLQRVLQGDLDTIVAKALRKNPAERYATVGALADDLRRHRAHEPIGARADSLGYVSAKFLRRHRGLVAASAVLVLAIAAGVAGTLTQAQRAEAQARRAEEQAAKAQQERDRARHDLVAAEATEEFMTFLLSSAADKPFTISELLLRGEALARQQFAGDPAMRARLMLSMSGLTSELDEQDRSLALMREAQAAAATTDDHDLQAAIGCALAADLVAQPDAALAAAQFDAALRQLAASAAANPTAHAACLNQRAMRAFESGALADSVRDSRAALAAIGTPRPGQRSLVLAIRMNLAGALARSGDLFGAVASLRQATDELEAGGRGQTLGAATFHNNLGVLMSHAGDMLAALVATDRAIAIWRGSASDPTAPLLRNRADLLLLLGRTREAVAHAERAATLALQRGDRRTWAYGIATFNHCPAGQGPRCSRRLGEARQALAGLLPPEHPIFAVLEATAADIALQRGQAAEAHATLQHALQLFDRASAPHHRRIPAAAAMARSELALGHVDAAAAHAEAALAQARQLTRGFAHSAWTGIALAARGRVQQAKGNTAGAQASWRDALTQLAPTLGDDAPATAEVRRWLDGP